MTVILSCGHECEIRPMGISIAHKSEDRTGGLAVEYSQYCHACYSRDVSKYPESVLFDDLEVSEFLEDDKEPKDV